MKTTFQMDFTVTNAPVLRALSVGGSVYTSQPEFGKALKRMRAVWIAGETEYDLGVLNGFSGSTSFSGTSGSIIIAWPDLKNPRTSGFWENLLVPADDVRIKVVQIISEVEIPLLRGVPVPQGIKEIYGRGREIVEIKIGDVTSAASRITDYALPSTATEYVYANLVAGTALDPIEHVTLYETEKVSICVGKMPNALMAADEALIRAQDRLDPLEGEKRIRYGDRFGRVVYRLMEDPDTGEPFNERIFADDFDFEYSERDLLPGLQVDSIKVKFSVSRMNPYLDLGSRVKLNFARGGITEIVQIESLDWRLMPFDERMTITARRQSTL